MFNNLPRIGDARRFCAMLTATAERAGEAAPPS
jgi:hypothetical protein